MEERIGIELTRILSKHVNLFLSEAETEEYPYAVYTSSVTPVQTKDGIHHYESDVTVTVYAKDLDVISPIVDNMRSSIKEHMSGPQYYHYPQMERRDCTDGVWSHELSYTIKQYQ